MKAILGFIVFFSEHFSHHAQNFEKNIAKWNKGEKFWDKNVLNFINFSNFRQFFFYENCWFCANFLGQIFQCSARANSPNFVLVFGLMIVFKFSNAFFISKSFSTKTLKGASWQPWMKLTDFLYWAGWLNYSEEWAEKEKPDKKYSSVGMFGDKLPNLVVSKLVSRFVLKGLCDTH